MTDHPILMKGDMVLAILGGYKSMTRRTRGLEDVNTSPDLWEFKKLADLDYITKPAYRGRFGAYFHSDKIEPRTLSVCPQAYPYGRVGDHLWVKETWRPADFLVDGYERDSPYYVQYRSDGWVGMVTALEGVRIDSEWSTRWSTAPKFGKWKPSIYMPRWASRILLKITEIRVERVQDIAKDENVNDIFEEGLLQYHYAEYDADGEFTDLDTEEALDDFIALWDSINKPRGLGWEFNPWVWVTTFEVVSKGEIKP